MLRNSSLNPGTLLRLNFDALEASWAAFGDHVDLILECFFFLKIILAKCPNTVWVSDGEELAEVSDIEVS